MSDFQIPSVEDVDDFRHNSVAPGLHSHVLCGEG